MDNMKVIVFCIDGVLVEVDRDKAEERIPYDIMVMQNMMKRAINNDNVSFLSPMTSDMIVKELNGEIVENINKKTVNKVSVILGRSPFFEDES